jgi:hypothetical protein
MEHIRPNRQPDALIDAQAVEWRYGPQPKLRRLIVWIDANDEPLLGSIDWYEDGEHVESVVQGVGPFETLDEVMLSLVTAHRLR